MWFAQQLDKTNPIFSGGQYVEIEGAVDRVVFGAAVHQAIQEAEGVHVRFSYGDDGPVQIPLKRSVTMSFADVSDSADPRTAAEALMWQEMAKPVDLERDSLYTSTLFKAAADRFYWFQRAHHIVCDGYSSSLFAGRVAEIYTAMKTGADFMDGAFGPISSLLDDDAEYRASDRFTEDRDYWLERLAGNFEVQGLADQTAQPAHTFLRETIEVSESVRDSIQALARSARTSWSVAVCAVMAVYASRMGGVRDVVLGLPVAARFGPVMRRTPGMAANIVPLRLDVDPTMSVRDLVQQASREIKGALAHQRYRFEDMRRDLKLGDGQRLFGPSVDVLRFQDDLSFGGHRATVNILSNGPVEDFNLAVYSGDSIPGLRICLDANPRLYDVDTLIAHRDRLALVFESFAAADPGQPIGAIGMLHAEERQKFLGRWHGRDQEIPAGSVCELVESQVARTPQVPAVSCDGDTLTYAELDARANRLARHLIGLGAGPERFVALALPRTVETVVAMLAVLKSGAAYVPVDVNYPADRIAFMLREAEPVLVITTREIADALPSASTTPQLLLDGPETADTLARHSGAPVRDGDRARPAHPLNPAYAIYTSGSTGRPKGVVISHRSMVDFLTWVVADFGVESLSHVLASVSLSFDPSVLEIFAPLTVGGEVELLSGPLALGERPRSGSYAGSVPSVISTLATGSGLDLRAGTIGLTGEMLTEQVVAEIRETVPACRIANLYGPTEAAVYSTAWFSTGDEVVAPPIGRPLPNTQVYLLDARLDLVPVGVVGEIYISGEGLARGYLNRPGMTADRFVPNPYGEPGQRMYRTGDLGRWGADGTIEYLGRADDQLKVRGFRVELGEIQTVLAQAPGVRHAVVVARDDQPGNKRIVGYVLPEAGSEPNLEDLTARLAATLPDYMVPAVLVVLDQLPLTPNGKLDRKALPEPDAAAQRAGRAPRNRDEEVLCLLVAELLGVPSISIDDNFFELGGNSLMAVKLLSRVRNRLNVELEPRDLFQAASVAKLVERHFGRGATPKDEPPRPALRPRSRRASEE